MKVDPIEKFKKLFNVEISTAQTKIPTACCLSTIGTDGYPNARFLSLKEVSERGFIITGSLSTKKGEEMVNNSKVALTFWWVTTEVQIRIQGDAEQIPYEQAAAFFQQRPREAQITSLASQQGQLLKNPADLLKKLEILNRQFQDKEIPCPKDWGGFVIVPRRIEFLEFDEKRLHTRTLYVRLGDEWDIHYLQP